MLPRTMLLASGVACVMWLGATGALAQLAPPKDIHALQADDHASPAIRVSWEPSLTADSPYEYRVFRQRYHSWEQPKELARVPAGASEYVDTDVAENVRYGYYMDAWDEQRQAASVPSHTAVARAGPAATPPRPPAIREAKDRERDAGGAIVVTFRPSPDDEGGAESVVGYNLYRSTVDPGPRPAGGDLVGSQTAGAVGMVDGKAETGVPYWYWLTATDGREESGPSTVAGPAIALPNPWQRVADILRTALALVLTLGLAIGIHEFGHMVVAKMSHMRVDEFAIGFGKSLWEREWGGTLYSVRLVPVGGFVRIRGMAPEEVDDPEGLYARPAYARVAVMIAGAGMNIVLAFVIYVALVIAYSPGTKAVVADLDPNGPAAAAGIEADDWIVAVDGRRYTNSDQIVGAIARRPSQPVALDLDREGRRLRVTVTPKPEKAGYMEGLLFGLSDPTTKGVIRVRIARPDPPERPELLPGPAGPVDALAWGGRHLRESMASMLVFVRSLVVRQAKVRETVGGPIAVASMVHDAQQQGLNVVLALAAYLNVCLAVFNLLPVPMLDGSRAIISIVEGLRGRLFDKQRETVFHLVGLVVLLGFALLVSVFDVQRMIGGGR